MEPLKVLEIDAGGGEVQLRSQSPTARDTERGYYEMRLFRQGMLRLQRFTYDGATRQRQPRACQLTREVLERLATTSSPVGLERARRADIVGTLGG